jgi:Ricin-type beta-trefoil lectin domain-like
VSIPLQAGEPGHRQRSKVFRKTLKLCALNPYVIKRELRFASAAAQPAVLLESSSLTLLMSNSSVHQRLTRRYVMDPENKRTPPNDRLLNIRNRWLEGNAPMPNGLIPVCEANVNNLLILLAGTGRNSPGTSTIYDITKNVSQPVTIINKLSDKALEVGGLSENNGTLVRQITRNDAPNQRWFVKQIKFIKHRSLLRIAGRELPRYWPTFLLFPQAVYSVISDHNGLRLGILNDSNENSVVVRESYEKKGNDQLWAFVRDRQGFNFIVNVHSGQVLEVADKSRKNYAQVRQYAFTGADNQRWQFVN